MANFGQPLILVSTHAAGAGTRGTRGSRGARGTRGAREIRGARGVRGARGAVEPVERAVAGLPKLVAQQLDCAICVRGEKPL